jgi:hypothetical protein
MVRRADGADPDATRADRRRADRTALRHLVRGTVSHPGTDPTPADLPAIREASVARLLRLRVALAAVDTGRVTFRSSAATDAGAGFGTAAAPAGAPLDQVGAAYPGWLFAPECGACSPADSLSAWPVEAGTRREAIAVLTDSTRRADGTGPAAGYPHLLEFELRAGEAGEDGDRILGPDEWGGDEPLVLATDGDRRRTGGTYYTPPAVVDGVVERALRPALDRIGSGEDPIERALSVRVVDPAVGTGRFLVSAVECLTRATVDAAEGVDPARIRRRVAENCVYGVDLDPLAVELARATLWLRTGASAHVDALRTGDALVGAAPGETDADHGALADRALDWPAAFPDLPGRERPFDAVVGNPPYVRSRALVTPVREHLRERYRTATGSFDLYVPFLERAAALGDRVGMVVSNKWTTAEYARELRSSLVEEWAPATVVDCSALDVFPEAEVYPVVLACTPGDTARASDDDADAPLSIRTVSDPAAVGPGGGSDRQDPPAVDVSAELLDRIGGVVPLDLDPAFAPTLSRVLSGAEVWGDHVRTTEGIHTGNARETLVVEDRVGDACRPLADGRSIDRYVVEGSGEWVRYDDALVGEGEYADLRNPALFEDPKLLVRDISDRPVAAYDDDGLYALNTLYSARSTGEYPLRYLLSVFNSAFVARFFSAVYGGTRVRDGYLRFKPTFVDRIPVPDPDPDRLSAPLRERLAAHPATAVDDPAGVGTTAALTDALGSLTRTIETAKADRAGVETDPLSYLDGLDPGPALGDLPGTVADGVASTPLADTTTDRDGLRVGRAGVAEDDGELVVRATARFRPDGDPPPETTPPDSWGFVETDPVPALRVDPGDRTLRELVRSLVPAAVDRGDGVANFRSGAAKTITPLDRLSALTVPDPDDAAPALCRYRRALRRAAELDRRVARADELVDRAVADLYGLDAAERNLLPSRTP